MDKFEKRLVDALMEHIEAWRTAKKPHRTDKQLAMASGIHHTIVSNIRNDENPRLSIYNVQQLIKGLGLSGKLEERRLLVLYLEKECGKTLDLIPLEWGPEEKAERLKGAGKKAVEEALKVLFDTPESVKKLESVNIFLAVHSNSDLRSHIKAVVDFADKRKPLDGLPRRKGLSPVERERKKLRKAKRASRNEEDRELQKLRKVKGALQKEEAQKWEGPITYGNGVDDGIL